MTHVRIDQHLCMGTGFCARIAPELFAIEDGDQVASVLRPEVPTELEEAARDAEDACPAAAITVEGGSDLSCETH